MTNELGCVAFCDAVADTLFTYDVEGVYKLYLTFNGRLIELDCFDDGGTVWFSLVGLPQGYLFDGDLFDPSGVLVGQVTFTVKFNLWN